MVVAAGFLPPSLEGGIMAVKFGHEVQIRDLRGAFLDVSEPVWLGLFKRSRLSTSHLDSATEFASLAALSGLAWVSSSGDSSAEFLPEVILPPEI